VRADEEVFAGRDERSPELRRRRPAVERLFLTHDEVRVFIGHAIPIPKRETITVDPAPAPRRPCAASGQISTEKSAEKKCASRAILWRIFSWLRSAFCADSIRGTELRVSTVPVIGELIFG
jgi:hypothetical protein